MDEVVGEYPKKACQVKNAFDNGDMFVATPMGGRAAGLFITPFINESTLHEMLDLGVISEDEFRNWNDAEVGIVVGKGMRILNDREWDLPHNVCLDK